MFDFETCFWSMLVMTTAWKNVNFPESKPPNLNTEYVFCVQKGTISLQIPKFLPSKFQNFPPNTNIFQQGASHIAT